MHGVHCDQALDKMPKVGVLYGCTLKLKACMGYIVTQPLAVCQGWSALWMHFEIEGMHGVHCDQALGSVPRLECFMEAL